MKRLSILIAAFAAAAVSCVKDPVQTKLTPVVMVQELEFTYPDTEAAKFYTDPETNSTVFPMVVGESVKFDFNVNPSLDSVTNPEIEWSSVNPEVASVDQTGKVTALSAGTTAISIEQKPVNLNSVPSITVKVSATLVPASSIVIQDASEGVDEIYGLPKIAEGESMQMTATVAPVDATYKTVIWSVTPGEKASIDPVTGVLTGIQYGKITVKAEALDGKGAVATHEMIVDKILEPTGVKVTETELTMSVTDAKYALDYATYPAVCTTSRLVWTSSDETVLTVDKGVVTVKGFGKATINVHTRSDEAAPEGFFSSIDIPVTVPAGFYREHNENPDLWITKTNGATKELRTSEQGEKYLYIVPNKANANTGRGDFGHAGETYISKEYPIITIRVDDVNDKIDETGEGKFSRNINLDTSGTGDDGIKYSGNYGGSNNKWYRKYTCSDGSAILVYDLVNQNWQNGTAFPDGVVITFTTWQLKYADIRNHGKEDIQDINNLSYRFFWHHTFKTMDEFNAYLAAWSAKTGITYE